MDMEVVMGRHIAETDLPEKCREVWRQYTVYRRARTRTSSLHLSPREIWCSYTPVIVTGALRRPHQRGFGT
jgi:hypothetical protein